MIALAQQSILAFTSAALVAHGDDETHYSVQYPDGSVLSVQPDGTFETRPSGTADAYEVAQKVGDKLVYGPYQDGACYVVPIVELSA